MYGFYKTTFLSGAVRIPDKFFTEKAMDSENEKKEEERLPSPDVAASADGEPKKKRLSEMKFSECDLADRNSRG